MRRYLLRLDLEWELELPDEVTEESDIFDELSARIVLDNQLVENIFWENIEVVEKKDDELSDEEITKIVREGREYLKNFGSDSNA